MSENSFKKILLLLLSVTVATGCGVNDAQINFEQEALSPPSEITEMTVNGVPVEGEEADESDWRIAPEFRGLVEVQTPAFPNPAPFNSDVRIYLSISGIQAVNGLYVYVYRPNANSLSGPYYVESGVLNPGLITITISPRQFTKTGTGNDNLYRIVIYDGSQSIITYGDVKVQ